MSFLFDPTTKDTLGSPNPRVAASAAQQGFEQLIAQISSWCLVEHNADGTHNMDAKGIVSGLIKAARLGTGGDGSGNHFLADNQTFQSVTMTGEGRIWFGSSAPTGWLLCDGSPISRTTYAALFALIGTTYGAGNGTTTFNLPDLRQRFPLGKAASGTGSTLGSTGGAIDHTHTVPALTIPSLTVNGASVPSVGIGGNAGISSSLAIDASNNWLWNTSAGWKAVAASGTSSPNVFAVTNATTTGTTTTVGSNTGSGTTGTNNPPYQVVNYIIKT